MVRGDHLEMKVRMEASSEDRNYVIGHAVSAVGDWFEINEGEVVDMEVLIGEIPENVFALIY